MNEYLATLRRVDYYELSWLIKSKGSGSKRGERNGEDDEELEDVLQHLEDHQDEWTER